VATVELLEVNVTTWRRVKPWVGGYVRQKVSDSGELKGPLVYVIEKWIDGIRFHASTRCNTEGAAFRQLARFQADPTEYTAAGSGTKTAAVRLTDELVDEYFDYQLAKGCTLEWAAEMSRVLGDWTERIGDLDLRHLSLHTDLKPVLETWPKRKSQRIKGLKGFMRWLRTEKGLVTHSQDATVDLRVPPSRPEKWERRKVVPSEDVQAVLLKLEQPYRDILHLLTATAWHITEVRRFVEGGEIVMVASGEPLAVLMTRHKGGEIARTRIDYPEHLEAAQRLLALRGKLSWPKGMTFVRVMKAVCASAEVPVFQLGVMRHSVLTWAYELGGLMPALRDFAGHKSENTTRRFYVDAAVPQGKIPVLRLLQG
jgi:integrase